MSNLNATLLTQVEYYFSPQNLSKDGYLRGQLVASSNGRSVPISTISRFGKVREICQAGGVTSGTSEDDAKIERAIVDAVKPSSRLETFIEESKEGEASEIQMIALRDEFKQEISKGEKDTVSFCATS